MYKEERPPNRTNVLGEELTRIRIPLKLAQRVQREYFPETRLNESVACFLRAALDGPITPPKKP